jgi:hypothetical protein
LNILDWLWNLPALPALVIWGAPVEGAIMWLIFRVRKTVGKSSKMMDVLPELNDEQRAALAWSLRKAIDREVQLYRAAKSRGEVR